MLLYPVPQRIDSQPGRVARPAPVVFAPPPLSDERFARACASLGFTFGSEEAPIELRYESCHGRLSGYHLSVGPDRIALTAASSSACYHGLVTLRQILKQAEGDLPCMEIEDWPDLAHRGFMLDISRCKVPSMATLRELVDQLAALKYNQFQLYVEHTFAYRDHETVWRDASPLTAEEVRELDTYCHDRYIELVPNQNSFGHMERWLRHDRYKPLAECPAGFHHPLAGWKNYGSTLKPTQESIEFVDTLYEELLPNFRSRAFNIGGDEPWELGQGFSRERVTQEGKHRVYLEHLKKLQDRVEARQREMQFWGDILLEKPELATELSPNATALLWGYERTHPFEEQCAALRATGRRFYVVPGTSTWNTLGGRLDNALATIDAAARSAKAFAAEGLLLTEWGDNGHHQSSLLSVIPLLRSAGLAWSYAASQQVELCAAAERLLPHPVDTRTCRELLELGHLPRLFSKHLHNGTWLNKTLFTKPKDAAALAAQLDRSELQRALEQLSALQTHDELELARQLLLFAARKGLALLAGDSPRSLPNELVERYRAFWLARNRSGGLVESVRHLTEANP